MQNPARNGTGAKLAPRGVLRRPDPANREPLRRCASNGSRLAKRYAASQGCLEGSGETCLPGGVRGWPRKHRRKRTPNIEHRTPNIEWGGACASDGSRLADGFFSSSLAPVPGARLAGPISLLQTYGKLDYTRICNGGPITMELSDAVFRSPETIRKVAMLIRTFAALGCQQLQLNTLDVEKLKDAKAHPEEHRDLIVRVWGWSGYFCELAPEYQDHVIARHKYQL
jgi:pyruvate-formate lyase